MEEINYANDNIENVRNQIKESYPKDLVSFLTENPLADEAFYLKRELKGYKKALKTLKKDTAFNNLSEVNEDTPRFRNFFFRITESCKFFKLRLKELKQPENAIIEANEYVLLILNSYFDAQESLGNEPDFIDLVKDLFQQTILRVGKKQEKENLMTPYEFNSRIYFALTAMMQCGFNDDWETTNSTKFMRIENIVKDIKRPISRIEFKNIGDWIEELISIKEPQQLEPEPLDLLEITKSTHGSSENPFAIDLVKNYFDLRLESQRFDIDLKQSFKMFLIRKQKSLKQTDFISKKEFYSKFKAYVNSLGYSILSIQSQLEEIEDFKDNAGISLETFWKHKGKFRNEILKIEDVNLILEIISELLLKSNPKPQQTEPGKKLKPKSKTLNEFFKDGTAPEIIKSLQNNYKDYNGKKMAYLIYLLHKEFNLINYSLRGIKDSRKRFVNEFTGKNLKNIEGINKIFNPNDITLGIDKYHKDNDYITIQNEIQTILNPVT
jgi:hypothetical protein